MTDIDFYILDNDKPQGRELMACRLAEKIYKLGRKIHIHTESASDSKTLDALLWTFRDGSFVPHNIAGQATDAAVIIGHGDEPQQHNDVLINLATDVPLFFSRFERVTEIIGQQDKAAGRERFRFYRDRGYPLKSHPISA